jgi:hypothetical protein
MTQDLPQPSPLAQRLQQRSLTSPGVINLKQWSIDRTQATIQRMVQRELLPSQIESHYQTAGVTSPMELPGRVRVETLDRVSPALDITSPPPTLQRATSSMFSDPVSPLPSWNTSPEPTILPSSSGTFRVSRKPTSDTIFTPANVSAIGASSTPASVPVETVTKSTAAQERVRVQHPRDTLLQGDVNAQLLMAKPSIANSLDPISPTAITPMSSERIVRQHDFPESLSSNRGSLPAGTLLPRISIETVSSNPPLPLVARSQSVGSAEFPATSEDTPTPMAADTGKSVGMVDTPRVRVEIAETLRSPTVPMPIAENSQPLIIARLPAEPQSSSEKPLLQAKTIASVETPSPDTVPLSETMVRVQPLVQNNVGAEVSSVMRRQSASESISRSLPLYTQVPVNTIVRQTETMGGSISVPISATPSPPPPAPKSATEAEPDLKQMTDRVSRLLTRQLIVERERRGMQRW